MMFINLRTILLFVFLICGAHASNKCKDNDSCTCENFIMDCRNHNMKAFPKKIPQDVKALYMDNNGIHEISTQIDEYPELQTLVLTNNNIKHLNYDTFDNLDNLKTLQLTNNEITSIADDIFEWNPLKLEVLYLDGNNLEFIQHFLFYDLEELTDLYLQNNSITFIHPHAFLQLKNLRNLRLDGNALHTFNYKWIEKLQANSFTQLRFDSNPWSCDCAMLSSQKWLKNEKSKWFHELLGSHPITCSSPDNLKRKELVEVTKGQVNETCDLPGITGISSPTSIDSGRDVLLRCVYDKKKFPVPTVSWTAPNKDIYRLNTAENFDGIEVHQDGSLLIRNLSKIDNGTYTCNATNSAGSFIARTKIIVLPTSSKIGQPFGQSLSTKSVIRLTAISPTHTSTVTSHKSCPAGCQCISRHVDCSGDGITVKSAVPDGIPIDAITISLASNNLTSIRASDFSKFQNLEELRLDDNRISHIDSHAFSHLPRLTTLTLQQNRLKEIEHGTFSKLNSLNVLVLDKNKLLTLTGDMFKGLHDLQWLYVRHNGLRVLGDDAFTHLKSIKFIHLESNEIGVLHPEAIQALVMKKKPTVSKIFVDDNNIQCDCNMEEMRRFVRDARRQEKLLNLFGDGILCSNPPDKVDKKLNEIAEEFDCGDDDDASAYSGLLFGGITVGVVLTIIIAILWSKYGRSARQPGKARRYDYSSLVGTDESVLKEQANEKEAFV